METIENNSQCETKLSKTKVSLVFGGLVIGSIVLPLLIKDATSHLVDEKKLVIELVKYQKNTILCSTCT